MPEATAVTPFDQPAGLATILEAEEVSTPVNDGAEQCQVKSSSPTSSDVKKINKSEMEKHGNSEDENDLSQVSLISITYSFIEM